MKCALYGLISPPTADTVVDISSLNLTSPEDYMVIVSGDGYAHAGDWASDLNMGTITDKTATSFTIQGNTRADQCKLSYQVITFR